MNGITINDDFPYTLSTTTISCNDMRGFNTALGLIYGKANGVKDWEHLRKEIEANGYLMFPHIEFKGIAYKEAMDIVKYVIDPHKIADLVYLRMDFKVDSTTFYFLRKEDMKW